MDLIYDEEGRPVYRLRHSRHGCAPNDEDRQWLRERMERIFERIAKRPRTLLEYWMLGTACVEVEDSGHWVHDQRGKITTSFSLYLAGRTAYSRQKIDRMLLMARVFSADTMDNCDARSVGFRVIAELAGAHWLCRPVLVKLAQEGASMRAIACLRDAAERRLLDKPEDMDWKQFQEELEPALRVALEEWHAAEALAERVLSNRDVALLKRERALDDRERALEEKAARMIKWERSLAEREHQLAARAQLLGLSVGEQPAC